MTNQILEAYENLRQQLQAKEEENRKLREAARLDMNRWDRPEQGYDPFVNLRQALQALEEDNAD